MHQERKRKKEKGKTAEWPTALRCAFCFSFCLLPFSLLAGCQAAGVLAYKLHGPAKVSAEYVPQKKPMLVFVENYEHQSSVNAHADLLGRMLVKELDAHKIAPLVSLDFRGNDHSSILDAPYTSVMDGDFVKLLSWYDNEWGYSSRCVDLLRFLEKKGL